MFKITREKEDAVRYWVVRIVIPMLGLLGLVVFEYYLPGIWKFLLGGGVIAGAYLLLVGWLFGSINVSKR